MDLGALDMLGGGLFDALEASKDPAEEAKRLAIEAKENAADSLNTAIKTESLAKGLATKFKLDHKNVDEAGKRTNLLVVDQVTSTSARLRWTRPKTRYRLDGVRVMVRESFGGGVGTTGAFTTVVDHTREAELRSRVVVGLKSDTEYEFQLVALHDMKQKKDLPPKAMIVDGTKVTSAPIRTTKATYSQAFFFEDPSEINRTWAVFFGVLDRAGGKGGDDTSMAALTSGDDYVLAQKLKLEQTGALPEKPSEENPFPRPCCLTGRQCMVLKLPGGLDGGCCADIEVKESRRYRIELFIFHECKTDREELPHDSGCKLIGYDYRETYTSSKRARLVRQWEKLEVELIGAPGDRAKIGVQASRIYQGEVLVDACRIFMLGRDEIGDCCSELEVAAGEPRLNETGVLRVTVLEVVNLPRFSGEAPPVLPEKALPLPEKTEAELLGEDEEDTKPAVARRKTMAMKKPKKEIPAKPRLVIKWGAKIVGETEVFDAVEEEKKAMGVTGGITPQAIAIDGSRPSWKESDQTVHTLKVRSKARIGGVGFDEGKALVTKSFMRDSVFEIEVQDTTVRGVAAKAKRRKFELGAADIHASKRQGDPRGGRRKTKASPFKVGARPGSAASSDGAESEPEAPPSPSRIAAEERAAEDKKAFHERSDRQRVRRQSAVLGDIPKAPPGSPGPLGAFLSQGSGSGSDPGSPVGAAVAASRVAKRPGTPGTDSEDEQLLNKNIDTSKSETDMIYSLGQSSALNIAGNPGLLAASRGEQRKGRSTFASSMFGRKKNHDEDDGGGAPIGRLRLSTNDLFAAQPYRTWYRLEDENGLTHMCVALVVRYWDPVPRIPVYNFMARDAMSRKEREAEKERAMTHNTAKAAQAEKKKQRDIAKSIGAIGHRLASEHLSAKTRNTLLGKLIFMLGCSTGARVTKAGASKTTKKIDDGAHAKNLQGQFATMSIDRMDPTEAQARIPVPELLKRKAEMVRQGVLEECVSNLANPRVSDVACALIVAIVTFPKALIVASSDIHRCSAALQAQVRGLGVLDWVEEACDTYTAEIHGAGASAKDDDHAVSDASRAVATMTHAEKAVAHAFRGGRCAPAHVPSAGNAGALLACVFGGSRTQLVVELAQRPNLFPALARAVQEGVSCARKCLANLNFATTFPPRLVDQYRRFRVLVPILQHEYWRCPSLETELDADDEEMQTACRNARKRARAAERHRLATGAFPRRIRVASRDTSIKMADGTRDFADAVKPCGGHAFYVEDAQRPDIELVAVAYGELREGVLEDLKSEMQVAVPGQGGRATTPGSAKGRRRPGSPEKRSHTPQEKAKRAEERRRLLEEGDGDPEEKEKDLEGKFAAFFHRDSESDGNASDDGSDSDSELSTEGAEAKARRGSTPEVEGAGNAGMSALLLGKQWRRKSLAKRADDEDARKSMLDGLVGAESNPLRRRSSFSRRPSLEERQERRASRGSRPSLEERPDGRASRGSFGDVLAAGSKWRRMSGTKREDLPLPDPGDGDAPLNPAPGRRRSFGQRASGLGSVQALRKIRDKLKGEDDDDD